MEKMEIKIGDKVVVTSSTSESYGMRAEVRYHSDTQHKSWLFFDALHWYAWFDDADLSVVFEDDMSRKESKMKFKVGDKVIINEKCTAYKDLVGKRGTIADVIEGRCKVEVGNDEHVWITDEVVSLDNSIEIKIGDKVIVSGNVPHYGGCKGKVVDVYGSIKTYAVEVMKNGEWFSRTFLADELILDNDELRRVDEKMLKHFGYVRWEVGDKVIIHSYDCNGYYFGKHGTIAEANPLGNYRVKIEETGSYDWFAGSDLSRDIRGVEPRKKGSDVWHVNLAELAGRTVSGCKGLAFGEEM